MTSIPRTEGAVAQSVQFVPPPISKLEDTGLSLLWLQDLTLKIFYYQGYLSGFKVAEEIALPFAGIVDQILETLSRELKKLEVSAVMALFGGEPADLVINYLSIDPKPLQLAAIAPGERQAGAVAEHDHVLAMEQRLELLDPLQVDDGGAADAQELVGRQAGFQHRERLPQQHLRSPLGKNPPSRSPICCATLSAATRTNRNRVQSRLRVRLFPFLLTRYLSTSATKLKVSWLARYSRTTRMA